MMLALLARSNTTDFQKRMVRQVKTISHYRLLRNANFLETFSGGHAVKYSSKCMNSAGGRRLFCNRLLFFGNKVFVRFTSGNGTGLLAKKTPKKTDLQRLFMLAAPEKWKLTLAVGFLLVSSAVTMVVPFGIGRVIDIIYNTVKEKEEMIDKLAHFCKILLAIFLVGAVANFARVYIMSTSGNRIVKKLREDVFSSIIRQEIAFFDKNRTGELINRLSADTGIVGHAVTMNISDGLRSVCQAIGGVTMMIYTSAKLAGIALLIVPPVILASRIYGRYVQKITKQVQDSLAGSTQVAEERIGNIRTVRAFAKEMAEENVYSSRVENVLNLAYKEALARGVFWASTGLSGNIMIISIFFYGGLMMNEALITVGELSSFMLYAAFVGMSIGGLSTFYSEMMRGVGASGRLFDLIDKKPRIPVEGGLIPSIPIRGDIEFANTAFSYPTRPDIPVFTDLNLFVPKGSSLAVVGPSGSGKSTIANLLLRYYDPDHGQVTLDGENIRSLDPHWLRNQIGFVNQEPSLFSTSIAENITYGVDNPNQVTVSDIEKAAREANALQFINRFPDGLDTKVGERGIMLSGGQKQRIAIARAILKNPRILLLDEATSALDAESEYLVQEALERIMLERTVLIIAHRLSTIRSADNIAVLSGGTVVEYGPFEKLMDIPEGVFKKLVERQTSYSW